MGSVLYVAEPLYRCTRLVFCYMFIEICPAPDPGFNSRKTAEECGSGTICSEPLYPAEFFLHVYRDMTRAGSGFEFPKNCLRMRIQNYSLGAPVPG